MKKVMLSITAISFAGMIISIAVNCFSKADIALTLAITFGTCLYHFAMRLIVGYTVNGLLHNKVDYKLRWFKTRRWEISLYKKLKVKGWKSYIPSFAPETFSLDKNSAESVIGVTCQAELVHEIIMVLSFVPLIFSVWFEEFFVFLITSVFACLFDGIFVILQRYNRPRLLNLFNRISCDSN